MCLLLAVEGPRMIPHLRYTVFHRGMKNGGLRKVIDYRQVVSASCRISISERMYDMRHLSVCMT